MKTEPQPIELGTKEFSSLTEAKDYAARAAKAGYQVVTRANYDQHWVWVYKYPQNKSLLPLKYETCDWKERLPFGKLSKIANRLTQQYGLRYEIDEINVWTADEHIGLVAPVEAFNAVIGCGYEFFVDQEYLMGPDDEEPRESVVEWYWDIETKTFWVQNDKGEFYDLKSWQDRINELNPDSEDSTEG